DTAIGELRQQLDQAPKRIREAGEPEAERELRPALDALARLVLHPLLPHAGKASSWLVSPDAGLWLVPWQALTLPDGSYAVEKYPIQYAISGRDLVPARAG